MIFRFTLSWLLIFLGYASYAQPVSETDKLIGKLNIGSLLPAGLCAGRSVVLHEASFSASELQEAQKYFQQAGIDAVLYIDSDYVLSGLDPSRTFSTYFSTRNIKFLILLQKSGRGFQIIITEYNGTNELVDNQHVSWKLDDSSLPALLQAVYRFCISTQKKENLLINDVAEREYSVRYFRERDERFTPDIRLAKIAIPRMGNEADDKDLEEFLKEKFPFKYQLVDPALKDNELEEKGFRLVLRFVHTRGDVARDILGYDVSQTASSLLTNYFDQGVQKIKTMSSKKKIYKFYFKNSEYGNIFLGTHWDADETWQDALRNHILLMRAELKL
ncbi:MAG: hypothetical protein OJF59_001190 [Cytophagales bacterium]|jgi:hypothetical protein|nr:hypothetical protein [Bacteroidota bacterium]MBS1981819.1 hypothetical protein [Bacteroidota bacterium]WHZ07437.1 MAG: hypothetical protein OJF59_001190 [Cytophagales bacterium]